jgi:hypothetical protein
VVFHWVKRLAPMNWSLFIPIIKSLLNYKSWCGISSSIWWLLMVYFVLFLSQCNSGLSVVLSIRKWVNILLVIEFLKWFHMVYSVPIHPLGNGIATSDLVTGKHLLIIVLLGFPLLLVAYLTFHILWLFAVVLVTDAPFLLSLVALSTQLLMVVIFDITWNPYRPFLLL